MVVRHCTATTSDGRPCQAAPLVDGTFCYLHDPAKASEAAEARRLGGLRRRREKTITTVYALEGLDTVAGIRRVLEIAVADAMGLENSVGRARVLISAATAAAKLVDPGEQEALLTSLGFAVGAKRGGHHDTSGFEDDDDLGEPEP
jgi:hypothetical protein